jgi:hypothetical protein
MKTERKTATLIMVTLAAATLVGCGGNKVVRSGFLDDYSILSPNPEVEGALYYQKPGKSLRDYSTFIIDPVVIHLHAGAEGKSIDPGEMQKLTQEFHDIAVETLSKDYQVVDSSGPGVLRIQAAITDLDKNTAILNVHPALKATGLGLGGASMEAKALDSMTGELIIAVVDSRSGDRVSLDVGSGLTAWGSATQAMHHWVNRFKKRLDEAHGK